MRFIGSLCVFTCALSLTGGSIKTDTTFGKVLFVLAIAGVLVGLFTIADSFRAKYKWTWPKPDDRVVFRGKDTKNKS